jgi:Four helix bundle sensory module for signal transduction
MSVFVDPFVSREKGHLSAFRFKTGRFPKFALAKGSIRTQILIFSLAMSAIAAALGGYATLGIRHAGDLVARTFDESLMAINYARAAGADFAAMRVASLQRLATKNPAAAASLNDQIAALAKALLEDLTIAAERSQSARAAKAAAKVQEAVNAWMVLHRRALQTSTEEAVKSGANSLDYSIGDVDQYSKIVNQQVELLVNYTAGDGFMFRQGALSAIRRDLAAQCGSADHCIAFVRAFLMVAGTSYHWSCRHRLQSSKEYC